MNANHSGNASDALMASASAQNGPDGQHFRRWLLGIFIVGLVVRLLNLWLLRDTPMFEVLLGDAQSYDGWARQIAAGDWVGEGVFYQAPLYP